MLIYTKYNKTLKYTKHIKPSTLLIHCIIVCLQKAFALCLAMYGEKGENVLEVLCLTTYMYIDTCMKNNKTKHTQKKTKKNIKEKEEAHTSHEDDPSYIIQTSQKSFPSYTQSY